MTKKRSTNTTSPSLSIIKREAGDRRNVVKKAVNWALRQIGKRNAALNQTAIETAQEILAQGDKSTWVASDALGELTSAKVQATLRRLHSWPFPIGVLVLTHRSREQPGF